MGKINLVPDYILQVEFVDYGKHGSYCGLFIMKRDGAKLVKVADTPPQPANLAVCRELLDSIGLLHEIPEAEMPGLRILLETAFKRRAEGDRKKIVTADPFETAVVNISSRVLTAVQDCMTPKK